jgi:hypothetical protein
MTLYAIRQVPGTSSPEEADVVDESKYGWELLKHAVMLWRLVDNGRAEQIEAIKDRVVQEAGDKEVRIETEDLCELVGLLAGLEEAIVASGVVTSDWHVHPDRLEELAKLVPAMDLTAGRSLQSKTSALAEVMVNAISIRNFLEDAAHAGCVVVRA